MFLAVPEPGTEEVVCACVFDWLTAWLSWDRFIAVAAKGVSVWRGSTMGLVLNGVCQGPEKQGGKHGPCPPGTAFCSVHPHLSARDDLAGHVPGEQYPNQGSRRMQDPVGWRGRCGPPGPADCTFYTFLNSDPFPYPCPCLYYPYLECSSIPPTPQAAALKSVIPTLPESLL